MNEVQDTPRGCLQKIRGLGRQEKPTLVALIAWWALMVFLTSTPRLEPPWFDFPGKDKLAHAVMYGVLLVLLWRTFTFREREWLRNHALLVACVAVLFWGVLDELHQIFIPSRDGSIADFAANVAGVGLGALLAARYARLERRVTAQGGNVY